MNRALLLTTALSALFLTSCERKSEPQPPASPAPGNGAPSTAKPADKPGHGGAIVELGTLKIGDLTVRASRDEGELKAGGDAPIDACVTSADGQPADVSAVRFWIGAADAKGSIKARAEIEDPKQPNHWHTHVEVPDPLASDVKLWVEIEMPSGAREAASFELKR